MLSLQNVARDRFPFYPTSLLTRDVFNNAALLENYQGEVLIIHGGKDITILPSNGSLLYDVLNTDKKQFVLVDGVGHSGLIEREDVGEMIKNYISQ